MRNENPISIDLNAVFEAFGYMPHPHSFGNYLSNPITLAKVVNEQAETSIGALDISGVNIGYYNDYDEFVSTADDDKITDESSYWIWIKDDVEDEITECIICGEPVYNGGLIHEDLCDDCSEA